MFHLLLQPALRAAAVDNCGEHDGEHHDECQCDAEQHDVFAPLLARLVAREVEALAEQGSVAGVALAHFRHGGAVLAAVELVGVELAFLQEVESIAPVAVAAGVAGEA